MNLLLAGESFEVRFLIDAYVSGSPRVRLIAQGKTPVATLSCNAERTSGRDCFWLKDYAENEELADELIQRGYLEETGRCCSKGSVEISEVRLTAAALAEADDIRALGEK